ncbi:hypothetical protein [Dehalobacterium formicoaceticum]|uniref:Uncharacterized protein n=1 Tax=Dehalobacterium formicoaceticum TaxID=51515 RepID=A0ABT1Y4X7_9FIRM|nr:hypothetical protein [Dehalobacterium formicoaceticum]MCR6545924.1 hypothetical protein [Dehalobacterium formicoaceticum]
MSVSYKHGEGVSECVGLLISILLRYPEVGSIHFDPQTHEIRLTFIISGDRKILQIAEKRQAILEALQTYHQLEIIKPQLCAVEEKQHDHYSMIDVKRDVDTLTKDEISLLMELIQIHFPYALIVDISEEMWAEDIQIQDEMIGHMLEGIKNGIVDNKLVAYREEGKVLVFNR